MGKPKPGYNPRKRPSEWMRTCDSAGLDMTVVRAILSLVPCATLSPCGSDDSLSGTGWHPCGATFSSCPSEPRATCAEERAWEAAGRGGQDLLARPFPQH